MRSRCQIVCWLLLCILGLPCVRAEARQSHEHFSRLPAKGVDRFAGTTNQVQAGDTLDIHFSNPKLANQEVTINIVSGNKEDTVKIKLDKNGKGKTQWLAPSGWVGAQLTHQSSDDHGILIGR